jgi:predicted transcriptional regulator
VNAFETILELIKTNPGITNREMETKSNFAYRTINFQVGKLRKMGKIKFGYNRRDMRVKVWFVVE